ncbi:MAG TPA: HemK2/MTQ2 family protein methyltransferase, partial [Candidatus Binatia bacterium]|nr:HemK2/MTQ2 family protein methyltransferase [Candidatus Binatia bacterium]
MNVLRQSLERLLVRVNYFLWQRRRHNCLVLETVAEHDLLILPEVMNPHIFRSGETFAAVLDQDLVPAQSHVLDVGTGSGVVALAAAHHAERVVAVDINPAAVRCARINALLNNLEKRIEVREGDLFEAVQGEKFDVVLFNPPYFRGTPQPGFDQAWRSEDVVERFAAGLDAHLKTGGSALLI